MSKQKRVTFPLRILPNVLEMITLKSEKDKRSISSYIEILLERDLEYEKTVREMSLVSRTSENDYKTFHDKITDALDRTIGNDQQIGLTTRENILDRISENVHINKGIAGTSDIVHTVENNKPLPWLTVHDQDEEEEEDELSPEQIEAQDKFREQELERMAKDGSWNKETI